jgi:hypothetical protein
MRKQTEVFALGGHIKWSVLWVKPKGGSYEIIRHEYGTDLKEAMRVYHLALQAGKKLATLRSNNVAFPPPPQYMPHTRKRIKKVKKRLAGGKTKTSKTLETYTVIPMERLNLKGFYWCPYCREMRKFQSQHGFPIGEASFVDAPGMYCPLCGISHRHFSVRKYNPAAARQYLRDNSPRSRTSTASSTSRRSATRRTSRRTS